MRACGYGALLAGLSFVLAAACGSAPVSPAPVDSQSDPHGVPPSDGPREAQPVSAPSSPTPADRAPVLVELTNGEVAEGPDGSTLRLAFVDASYGEPRTMQIDLEIENGDRRGRFELSRGMTAPTTRTWYGLRLTLVDAAAEGRATVRVEGHFAVPEPLRVERDRRIRIAEGLEVTFRRHGHKHVMEGGPPSPLIIRYVHHRDGADVDEETRVETHEDRLFAMGAYELELVDHRYDAWMDVRVVGGP